MPQAIDTLSKKHLSQIQHLLEKPYNTEHSIWEAFERLHKNSEKCITFTIINNNEIIGIRNIGASLWGEACWGKYIKEIGVSSPIVGSAFTIHKDYRSNKLGKFLMQESTNWIKEHTATPFIFGQSLSKKACEMYWRYGAYFDQDKIKKLCQFYHCNNLTDFFQSHQNIELLPPNLSLLYAWCLNKEMEPHLKKWGYHQNP